ncbi:hypothetical protein Fmac_005773 [Flemingia macrophylla]|uniref:Uncharacterized protein n=1 Tax=Flemingia macrophylla TaxID=520843 RepID=A0ABD1N8P5_9FABA
MVSEAELEDYDLHGAFQHEKLFCGGVLAEVRHDKMVSDVNSTSNPRGPSSTPSPAVCFLLSAANTAYGAFTGSFYSYGPF